MKNYRGTKKGQKLLRYTSKPLPMIWLITIYDVLAMCSFAYLTIFTNSESILLFGIFFIMLVNPVIRKKYGEDKIWHILSVFVPFKYKRFNTFKNFKHRN